MRKLIPSSVISLYHWTLGWLAAFWYGNPSEKMLVIGVTGTNGKSTTVNLIGKIFMSAGYKVGWASTMNFRVGDRQWLNDKKMTMLGRFQLQSLLRDMVRAGCQVAIIETSSEGIIQWRHRFINYDAAVFTNLTPEHLERHGGFENYKAAKEKLFQHLTEMKHKLLSVIPHQDAGSTKDSGVDSHWSLPRTTIRGGNDNVGCVSKIIVVNADDPHAPDFLKYPADKKYPVHDAEKIIDFNLPMLGYFNKQNAALALTVAEAYGVPHEVAVKVLTHLSPLPGRQEFIKQGQPFDVMVDYAPEPFSLIALYKVLNDRSYKTYGKIIHVLGSAGGGRDKARRPIMGELVAKNADIVIVTNEDPYDEEPMGIIHEVASGARSGVRVLSPLITPTQPPPSRGRNLEESGSQHFPSPDGRGEGRVTTIFEILDRREAIAKALSLAESGDLVLITGKGCEQAMCGPKGIMTLWDDRVVVREELKKIGWG